MTTYTSEEFKTLMASRKAPGQTISPKADPFTLDAIKVREIKAGCVPFKRTFTETGYFQTDCKTIQDVPGWINRKFKNYSCCLIDNKLTTTAEGVRFDWCENDRVLQIDREIVLK